MAKTPSKKLTFKLTDEQLKALKPILDATGSIQIAGEVTGNELSISHLACNAAFIACNAAFAIQKK